MVFAYFCRENYPKHSKFASTMNAQPQKSHESYSPIENLPVEMLLEIFQYLDSWSIRRCSEVCITFFYLTSHSQFKKFFQLKMCDVFLAPNCDIGATLAAENRTNRTFGCLKLESVTFKTLDFAKNFFLRLGSEITDIEIEDTFFEPQMIQKGSETKDKDFRGNILNYFPCLEKLTIGNYYRVFSELQTFPSSLKEIYVKSMEFSKVNDVKDSLINEKGAMNLKKMICSKLVLYDDEGFPEGWKVTNAALENLSQLEGYGPYYYYFANNCNLMEHTVLDVSHITGVQYKHCEDTVFTALCRFPTIQSISLNIVEPYTCKGDNHQPILDFSHVKSFKMHFEQEDFDCITCITNILSSFTGLTKLNLGTNWTGYEYRVIFANMPKLEYLELHGKIPRHFFDSAEHNPNSIEQLKNLQHLVIKETYYQSIPSLPNKSFLHFSFLPNLKTLRIRQPYRENTIKISGIRQLVRQCPNIETFSFSDEEMSYEMLKEMICGWPRLTTLLLPNTPIPHRYTWNFMKKNCRRLKHLSISHYKTNLTFAKQCSLFQRIPSLNILIKGPYRFTRTDFYEKNVYLRQFSQRHSEISLKYKPSTTVSKSKKKSRFIYHHRYLWKATIYKERDHYYQYDEEYYTDASSEEEE
ncbi:uncharacterized protein LOC134834790 [Culicoides brevitarsis]|uniref:uncharacterized protein LOC134834790 n=1 Tax=Culicoides brevitarsis TaxID=469753 RepID=UPI00307B5409